jgi:hypothetical protein
VTAGAPAPRLVTADGAWVDGFLGPSMFVIERSGLRLVDERPDDASVVAHIPGTVFPGFTDAHVHLGLIEPAGLVAGGVARVVDLGFDPHEAVAARLLAADDLTRPAVEYAGALLTAPGGYPTDRSWAPASWSREVSSTDESLRAIAEMKTFGASRIKIALNGDAGPVWDDELLRAVIRQAHGAALPVVAHVEGVGQAERAARFGADVLAHTPFSERLDDEVLRGMAGATAMTTTLDIHGWGDRTAEFEVALDNLARFVSFGGEVRYGTDMGNGPTPVGLNERELAALFEAGLSLPGVVAALTPSTLAGDARISWLPGALNPDRADQARWLSTAAVVAVDELEETFA